MAEPRKESLIDLVAFAKDVATEPGSALKRTLRAIRVHLGMQVAFVSEFADGRIVLREVDAPGLEARINVGNSYCLNDVYCGHILEGRLPELIPDTSLVPFAMALPITAAAHVGSHISVPIRLPDGRVYGMFCCAGFEPNRSLNARDLQTLRAFADLAAFEINRELKVVEAREEKFARITGVIDSGQFSMVYQPIWEMRNRQAIGFECLTRFSAEPVRPPNHGSTRPPKSGSAKRWNLRQSERVWACSPRCPRRCTLRSMRRSKPSWAASFRRFWKICRSSASCSRLPSMPRWTITSGF
jgi:hypothetical protein